MWCTYGSSPTSRPPKAGAFQDSTIPLAESTPAARARPQLLAESLEPLAKPQWCPMTLEDKWGGCPAVLEAGQQSGSVHGVFISLAIFYFARGGCECVPA